MALRLAVLACTAGFAFVLTANACGSTLSWSRAPWPRDVAVVGYDSPTDLRRALRASGGRLVRDVPQLRLAEVAAPHDIRRVASAVARVDGVRFVERLAPRARAGEITAIRGVRGAGPLEWQFGATRSDAVAPAVLRASRHVTIAVVDTGADLTAPDLAAKSPATWNVRSGNPDVRDTNGHGTFVASLAAGSVTNDTGITGFGGDARLVVIKASAGANTISDVDEAAAIVAAIERGARIINLSFGGPTTSSTERRAIDYAVAHGALVVAATGNDYENGNPVQYPAALLQPVGSRGRGGRGLVGAAAPRGGPRPRFSGTANDVSVAAPGDRVLGALSALSSPASFPRVQLPGTAGLYGYGTGTSYAAPQVAGAAALVWAANPALSAEDVAGIIEATASGGGRWTPQLGYGVIDVAAAVARAGGGVPVRLTASRDGSRVQLSWQSAGAAAYRVTAAVDRTPARVVLDATGRTSTVFKGAAGRTYAFAVVALDAAGMPLGASPTVRVRLAR